VLQISPQIQSTEGRSAEAPPPSGASKKSPSTSFAKLLANLVTGNKASLEADRSGAPPDAVRTRKDGAIDPKQALGAAEGKSPHGIGEKQIDPQAGARLNREKNSPGIAADGQAADPRSAASRKRTNSAAESAEASAAAAPDGSGNEAFGVLGQKAAQRTLRGSPENPAPAPDADSDKKLALDQGKNRSGRSASKDGDSQLKDSSSSASSVLAQLSAVRASSSPAKIQADAEKDEGGAERTETKKRDKRKERIEIEVHDQRTRPIPETPGQALESRSNKETEMVLELTLDSPGDSPKDAAGTRSDPKPQSFQDALSRELRESANADIVRHASLVLKDGGEGLIRLSLKPESLGTVKVRLEMADNRIAGKIIVETEEALRAFEKELQSLEQAFVDGGFDGAGLEVSVSADGGGRDGGTAEGKNDSRPFYSERSTAAALSSTVYGASAEVSLEDAFSVNVLA
jgi:flagellar hook-length control protein FliK